MSEQAKPRDWADDEADSFANYVNLAKGQALSDLLAAKFRSVETRGAVRGAIELQSALREKGFLG
jgi:hypothetical protein